MTERTDNPPHFFVNFSKLKKWLWLVFLAIPVAAALFEFFTLGLARKTFVFYDINSGLATVEDRMLKKTGQQEIDITRYVEDVLLGPVFPNSLPLFPRETRLQSLLYRDGVVYADLSEEAVLPPLEGGEVFQNFKTLRAGIKRNFSFVGDVRFFIAGKAVYEAEFRRIGEFAGPFQAFLNLLVKNEI
jgi:hypothetical protein